MLAVLAVSVALLAGGAFAGFAQMTTSSSSVVGRIDSIDGPNITLVLADDTNLTVILGPSTLVVSRQLAAPADIKVGDALGVAARREYDGSLTATAVNIFAPELWANAQKGQWPMSDGQVMTNAMVTSLVSAVSGGVLAMEYQGGTASIRLPDGVPVHRIVAVAPASLQVGQRVAIRGASQADGSVAASSVSFDRAGG